MAPPVAVNAPPASCQNAACQINGSISYLEELDLYLCENCIGYWQGFQSKILNPKDGLWYPIRDQPPLCSRCHSNKWVIDRPSGQRLCQGCVLKDATTWINGITDDVNNSDPSISQQFQQEKPLTTQHDYEFDTDDIDARSPQSLVVPGEYFKNFPDQQALHNRPPQQLSQLMPGLENAFSLGAGLIRTPSPQQRDNHYALNPEASVFQPQSHEGLEYHTTINLDAKLDEVQEQEALLQQPQDSPLMGIGLYSSVSPPSMLQSGEWLLQQPLPPPVPEPASQPNLPNLLETGRHNGPFCSAPFLLGQPIFHAAAACGTSANIRW